MQYRRAGCSGLLLPAISLGLWHNFGGVDVFENSRAMVRRAFDLGITHFDLANNYGPPPGSAEANFGEILRLDLKSPSRRADSQHQGRLRYVARPLRRLGIAQVSAGQPRPEPEAHGRWSTWTFSTPIAPIRRLRSKRRCRRSIRRCARARRSTPASPTTAPARPPRPSRFCASWARPA